MRFTVLADTADPVSVLSGLANVASVEREGAQVTVTGTGDFATNVAARLAQEHLLVTDLRIDQRSLEDAFISLTGRPFDH
jgi:ABC-2 type transport system ATP-binding protein